MVRRALERRVGIRAGGEAGIRAAGEAGIRGGWVESGWGRVWAQGDTKACSWLGWAGGTKVSLVDKCGKIRNARCGC